MNKYKSKKKILNVLIAVLERNKDSAKRKSDKILDIYNCSTEI